MIGKTRWIRLFLSALPICLFVSTKVGADGIDQVGQARSVLVPFSSLLSEGSADRLEDPDKARYQYPLDEQAFSPTWDVWWHAAVSAPTRSEAILLPMTLESLLVRCLANSTQIKVFSDLPLIRRTAISEAQAAFDSTSFIHSRWDDNVDPVGSTLTGAVDRYRDHHLQGSAGMRKRTPTGGLIEASQQMAIQETNSIFFTPNPQGTSRLKLSYTHPWLRGKGLRYNSSLTCLAIYDTQVAKHEFSRQMQGHLTEVARAYWGLYFARAAFLIQDQAYSSSQKWLEEITLRAELDAVRPQILRAMAEVAAQEAAVNRARMTIRTSEARIRSLVNDPELGSSETVEIATIDTPWRNESRIDLRESLQTALCCRPEAQQSLLHIQAACLRLNVAKSEMLPILNVVTETYVAGLEGDADVGQAWVEQFSEGRPGYAVGSQFEVPLGMRAAAAQRDRRAVELRQMRNQYSTTLQSLGLEVGIAVREVEAGWAEFQARQVSLEAQRTQVQATADRWRLLPGDDGNGALVMEALLRDYDRLRRAEIALVESLVSYNTALFAIHKATGDLLEAEQVTWVDYLHDCGITPETIVQKPDLGMHHDPLRWRSKTCD